MKTPAPQRAAGRKKLAAQGQALPGGTTPIPDVAYLKKAIRAKGRVDPSKWPALKALIVKRAKALGATNTPGVKGTWAFQAANDGAAIELAYRYKHGWIKVGGPADEHITKAKQAEAEGRHADAINHLGAAINATADKSAAFHLTELKKEMAARAMGVPYKAKPLPKRLHAMANDGKALELVGPKGYEHGWIKVGVSEHDVPEDRADKMSGNVFKRTDGSQETLQGHRDAAKAHRYASRLSSSSATSVYHSKMAALHTRVASGRMTSNKAADQAHALRSGPGGYANGTEAGAVEFSSYVAPHLPAGSPAGGQFGSAQVASAAASNKAGKADAHDLHVLHEAHLAHVAKTGKTPAKKTAAKKTTAVKAKTTTAKKTTVAKPKVNKTKGTVTATIGGKKVTMTLHQWHQLHVAHEKAIKAANDTEAIEMATATPRKMPMVRGAADVQLRRTGPGMITVQHKSTGMKVGTITPKGNGWQGMHATGTTTGASGSQQGALTGLIAFHNKQAAKAKASGFPPAQQDGTAVMPGSRTYTAEQDAVDLAGALPVSTPASSSSDGPRVTSMGSGKTAAAPAGSPSGLSPYALAIYKKFIAKKMKPAVALAFAKRADAMHAKAA